MLNSSKFLLLVLATGFGLSSSVACTPAGEPKVTRDSAERQAVAGPPGLQSRVAEQLDRVLATSRAYHSLAREGQGVELDAAARQRLEALGYVDPGAP